MKKLSLTLAALVVMLACSSASAAVVRVGPVRVRTRPVARAAYVAPVARPAVRATVRDRRTTAREIIHDNRVDAWYEIQDALQ